MKRALLGMAGLLILGGCGAISNLVGSLSPKTVTVELVNASTAFDVDVQLFYGDQQDTLEALLTEFGTEVNRTLPPGTTSTFTRDCDALQAIIIKDADLRVLVGLGPQTNTDMLRDGTDFNCGDTLTFTFDHSAAIFDFDVAFDVR